MVRSETRQRYETALPSDVFEQVVWAVLSGLSRLVWMLLRWVVLFPMISVPLAACGFAAYRWDWPTGAWAFGAFLLLLVVWRLAFPRTFRRWVSRRIRIRWRAWSVYREQWASVCALHGLTSQLNDSVLVPALQRLVIGDAVDVLTVRMLAGQSTTDWQRQSEALAHAFGASLVRVRTAQPGLVQIEVQHADPLSQVVPVASPDDCPDLAAIRIGVRESGSPWFVRLIGRHLLVAGATGAGKGGVVWSILAGLGPAIRDGLVQVWVVDPKGGMEFGAGHALFSRFAYDTGEATLALLRDAAAVLSARAERLRGVARQHVPDVAEPLIVVVIDEIASLTAYITDRKVKIEVEQLLGLLLSQGRAVGVSAIACVQDPSKDVLALRQLFPTRIALRLTEATQAAMVLGQAARDRGALCELIPDSLPGVGYVAEDGSAEVTRVRAFHVTDDDIAQIASNYRPPA
ncbi:FtsK/SpoIIIE domain-containing protein [Nocardioides sp. J54]|uniref:FtsK/SpoIIIE domain-containing protein n=1 Tax=Nocardioides sp. J54 TaxID=935866 RepID=UPI000560EC1B|nr:FtsK/SpoIIIE domain-containing protein [Nocardioides sp. J54]